MEVKDEGAGAILKRTAQGAGWIMGWRLATRLLGLCSTLILARLLLPADFGLVALATTFASSLDTLSLLGVDDALIRIKAPRRALYDTAFTINLIRGAITAALLVALAGPVASFFNEPRMTSVLVALACGSIIVGGHNIGTIDFRREISFHKEFRLFVVPRILATLTTLICAFIFRSYWALIAGILLGRGMLTAYSYVLHPFRPRPTLSAWRELAGFSFWTWLLSIVGMARDRADSFFIGRILDTRLLGMFAVATEIASLPSTEFVTPLGTATFAGFSAAKHAGASVGETYVRVIGVTAALSIPAGFGISLLADPIVRLTLGSNWLQAVPVIEVAAAVGTLAAFGIISSSLFSAHAYLNILFRITLISMVLRGLMLWLMVSRYGIIGATYASGVGMFFECAIYLALACRRFGVGAVDLARRVWRTMLGTAVMVATLAATGFGWTAHPGAIRQQLELLVQGSLVGSLVYMTVIGSLWMACGRPNGTETDLIAFSSSLLRRRRPASL